MPNPVTSLTQKVANNRLQATQNTRDEKKQIDLFQSDLMRLMEDALEAVMQPEGPNSAPVPILYLDAPKSVAGLPAVAGRSLLHTNVFVLGDANCPVQVSKDKSQGAPQLRHSDDPHLRSMIDLAEANWSAASFRDLVTKYGREDAAKIGARLMIEILGLRNEAIAEPASADVASALLMLLKTVITHAEPEALSVIVVSEKDSITGPLAHYAGSYLDAPALDALLRGARVHADLSRNEIRYRSTAAVLCGLMSKVTDSHLWPIKPEAGLATLERIIEESTFLFAHLPWQDRQTRRKAFIGIIVEQRCLAGLPFVVREARSSDGLCAIESNYLILATLKGWLEGLEAMLEAGLDPDARDPGVHDPLNRQYSTGETALVVALTSKEIPDAVSLKIARSLIAHGASTTLTYDRNSTRIGAPDECTVREAVERAGLSRRWNLLTLSESKGLQDSGAFDLEVKNAARMTQLRAFLDDMRSVAQKVQQGDTARRLPHILKSLSRAHQLYLSNKELFDRHYPLLRSLVYDSGMLLSAQGHTLRTERALDQSLDTGRGQDTFLSLTYDRHRDDFLNRLGVWAEGVLSLPDFVPDSAKPGPVESTRVSAWLDELSQALIRHDGSMQGSIIHSVILKGKIEEAASLLQSDRIKSLKDLSLAFMVTISGLNAVLDNADKEALVRLAHNILAQCHDSASMCALVEVALRVGNLRWLNETLALTAERRFLLTSNAADDDRNENLLHLAADAPSKMLKSFCAAVSKQDLNSWLVKQDEAGDTPLHRAARVGAAQVKIITGYLDDATARVLVESTNLANRTPMLEALMVGQTAAFTYLLGLNGFKNLGDALTQVLVSRRGLLVPELLSSMLSNAHIRQLLLKNTGRMASTLARLGDSEGLEALLQSCRAQVFAVPGGSQTNVLHALAETDDLQMLQLLSRYATEGELRVLSERQNARGQLPEACTTDTDLAAALMALRGQPAPQVPKARDPGVLLLSQLRRAARQVATQKQSAALERSVEAFCSKAAAAMGQGMLNEERRQLVLDLAWQVIDTIDRAPCSIGVRMGTHFAMHRPEVTSEGLCYRATLTKSGASRFLRPSGLALLKARTDAIIQARLALKTLGSRMVIDVFAKGLAADGFINRNGHIEPMTRSETLRTVFAYTHQGLMLITAYAVA